MKKDYIYLALILIVFVAGFLFGKSQNDSGRFQFEHKEYQIAIFDTKTGLIYVKDNREYQTKHFKLDVINADGSEYKKK